jgi:hypothetical protein
MSRRTGLHPDQSSRQLNEKPDHLGPAQFAANNDTSVGVDTVNLKNMLCEVNPDRRNLHGEWLLSMAAQKTTTLWQIHPQPSRSLAAMKEPSSAKIPRNPGVRAIATNTYPSAGTRLVQEAEVSESRRA